MSTNPNNFQYQVGGSLAIENTAYVERQCDRDLLEHLRADEYCFVFNSRQMGKSSLRVRTMQRLQQEGFVCAVIDPQSRGTTLKEEQWYAGTIKRLIGDLHLEELINFSQWWKDLEAQSISAVERFDYFIEQVLLRYISQKIVIFIEEIDNLLSLKFDTDGFFILVRSLYERRAEKPEYQRLTFAFLGVATPSDLIRGKGSSAFNIGYAVAMSGFTLEEAKPLMDGLANKFSDTEVLLAEILRWTGGQPFLTQKILTLVAAKSQLGEDVVETMVQKIVNEKVIENWEVQDIPPHLKTIRDRILQSDEKGRGRLLGLYQQVLDGDGIPADENYDQMQLRLTGLAVKRDGRLIVYNPIYGAVFNQAWLSRALGDLRPSFYASAFQAWQESDEQKESFLLRGQALVEAEFWAKGKRLSDNDDQFLRDSREVEKRESYFKLEAEQQAREIAEQERLIAIRQQEVAEKEAKILGDAKQKADRRVKVGSAILGMTLLLATGAGLWAARSVNESNQRIAKTEQDAKVVIDKARDIEVNAYEVQKKAAIDKQKSEESAKTALEKKKEADQKVEEAQKNLVLSKAELDNVVQTSEEQVAAAEAKIADAESKVQEALTQQAIADRNVKDANDDIKLADVRLKTLEAKGDFYGEQPFDALLKAATAVHRFNALDSKIAQRDKSNTRMLLTANLSQFVYGVKEKNRFVHGHLISRVIFSPDGQTIAFTSNNLSIKLQSLSGKELQTFRGHGDSIYSLAFSPDGKMLASGSWDKTVKLWSSDGKELRTLNGHNSSVFGVAFSPDGKTIASASGDGTIKLWSLDGKEIRTFKGHSSYVYSVAFSPDGKTIASASWDNTVKLWSLDGKELQTFKDSSSVYSVAFSPDGKTIASASWKTIKLWSLDGKELQILKGHSSFVYGVTFSPSGKNIASASGDSTVKLWSLDGTEPQTFNGHSADVRSLAFSPDGKTIASASDDKIVKLWSLDEKEIQTLEGHNFSKLKVTFIPNFRGIFQKGSIFASASGDTLKLWSLDGKELQSVKVEEYAIGGSLIAISPDGKNFASAGRHNTVKLWSLDGEELQTLKGHSDSVHSIVFSPDGKTIASGSRDNTIKLWSLDGRELQTLKGHSAWVENLVFSPDGKTLASASNDKTVKLWSLDGKELQTIKGHSNSVRSIEFSPDGKTLASASWDKTVKLWSLDGKELQTFKGHGDNVNSVAFSPDGETIASASSDRTIKLWSLDGKELQTIKGHNLAVDSVVFNPDGKTLVSSGDNTIKLWNLNLDDLMAKGCDWLRDYLTNNPNATDEGRAACGIEPR